MSSPYIYFVISLCILQIQLPVTNPAPSRNKNYVAIWASASVIKRWHVYSRERVDTLFRTGDFASIGNLTSLAMHVEQNLLFFGGTSGMIRKLNLNATGSELKTSTPLFRGKQQYNLTKVNQLSVDWLNNWLYIISDSKISRCDLDGGNFRHLIDGFNECPEKSCLQGPFNVQVDPINGYLYWSLRGAETGGIYRIDLADLPVSGKKPPIHYQQVPLLIREPDISAFTLDFKSNRLFFPQKIRKATPDVSATGEPSSSPSSQVGKESIAIVSVHDGKNKEVFKDESNVAKSMFGNFKEILYLDNTFYWTDGIKYFMEDCSEKYNRCSHFEFILPDPELGGIAAIVIFDSSLQPPPIPKTPVPDLSAMLTDTRGRVAWNKPLAAGGQGKGAFNSWLYEIEITGNFTTVTKDGLKDISTNIQGLIPNTNHTFKVRSYWTNTAGVRFNGSWCYPITVKTKASDTLLPSGPPTTPILMIAMEGSGKNKIEWSMPPGCSDNGVSYELEIRGSDDEEWGLRYNKSQKFWPVQGLTEGGTYYARVRAVNMFGKSAFSPEKTFYYPPIASPLTSVNNEYLVAVFTAISVFCAAFLAIICLLTSVKKPNGKSPSLNELQVKGGRGVNELVPLPELPSHPHRSNILYSNSGVNLEEELSMVPRVGSDQIEGLRELGSGAFGKVYEGYVHKLWGPHSPKTKVAIKTLRDQATEQEKRDFIKEAKTMGTFNHPHILRLLAVCVDSSSPSLILELMEGGDLLRYLKNNRPTSSNPYTLTGTDLLSICIDVAKGCKYLEDMRYVHRDLACRNCLVSSNDRHTRVVKLGDFGFARDVYKSDYYRRGKQALMPVRWMPPESISDGVFTTQSDVWSFGVLLWEIWTLGERPYYYKDNSDVADFVRTGGVLPRPEGCPDEIYALMRLCWSYDPDQRPSFAMCLQRLEMLMSQTSGYSGSSTLTSVHNKSYTRNTIRKTSHSKGPSTATNSMDEGIESASAAHMPTPEITCTSSHLLPPYLKVVSSQEILNASTLDSHGYERPIEVTTSGMRFNRLRHPIRLRSHSHCTPDNNSTARLGSCLPPPTYSQIFSSSQSTTTSCTEISSPHSISPFDENCRLEGDDDDQLLTRRDKSCNDLGEGRNPTSHSYVNEVTISSEMLRKKITPSCSRSLNILSKVNETFPRPSSRSSPEMDQDARDTRTSCTSTWTSLDSESVKECPEEDDDSFKQDFFMNGYKVPLVARRQQEHHKHAPNRNPVFATKETACEV